MNSRRVIVFTALLCTAALAQAAPNGLVVLLTDFGADSIYVGAIKGSMLTKQPGVRFDVLTNSVPAFDVVSGAYILAEAAPEFPAGTTFCCVVDPGVGTARKRIVVETKSGHYFVGPDNGLLSLVADALGVAAIHELANRSLWRAGEVSQTFQGRDVFGPSAAAIAMGVPLDEVGPKLDGMVKLDVGVAEVNDGAVVGSVIRIDVYGNLVTNIRPADLEEIGLKSGDMIRVDIAGQPYSAPWSSAYADVSEGNRLVIVQSAGAVELATNMRSLAEELGVTSGAPVTLRKAK